jgi:hypothetical protein
VTPRGSGSGGSLSRFAHGSDDQHVPVERYYCDSDFQDCSGWLEQDLDRKTGASARPLRFMRISLWNSAGRRLATTFTNASGWFSATFSMPGASCNGQNVRVQRELVRVHEADVALGSPRYRFQVVDGSHALYAASRTVTLSGSSTAASYTLPRTDTTVFLRATNLFYTAESALTEIVNWSSTLKSRLSYPDAAGSHKYILDPSNPDGSYCESDETQSGDVYMGYNDYAAGGVIRHELGHWVQAAFHDFQQSNRCLNYTRNDAAGNHGFTTCEYSYASNKEAVASFIAVRSITATDKNAWYCQYGSSTVQGKCSQDVASRAGDTDNDGINPYTMWFILGDTYANAASRCVVATVSCACGGVGQPACNTQATKNANGFRNEVQPARLYWDILDTNNEGSDDVDLSMGQFVTGILAMPSGTANGAFNEPNRTPCNYEGNNVKDYASRIDAYLTNTLQVARNTSSERTLNCVATAP